MDVATLFADLTESMGHWIAPRQPIEATARAVLWQASGKPNKPGKEPTRICSRAGCVHPYHQVLWTPGKQIPEAARDVFHLRENNANSNLSLHQFLAEVATKAPLPAAPPPPHTSQSTTTVSSGPTTASTGPPAELLSSAPTAALSNAEPPICSAGEPTSISALVPSTNAVGVEVAQECESADSSAEIDTRTGDVDPFPVDRRALSEDQLLRWLRLFHEHEQRWPLQRDEIVWDRESDGSWCEVAGEKWKNISYALHVGARGLIHLKGLSLLQFRLKHGLCDDNNLTDERILRWIRLFFEKEKKWPSLCGSVVWDKDASDAWVVVKSETWIGINGALRNGGRGLPRRDKMSLHQLRQQHGLHSDLSEEILSRWIRLYYEKENTWPAQADRTVWDQTTQGDWFQVEGENWQALNLALRAGGRGLDHLKGSSLPLFRQRHGLTAEAEPRFTEEKIVEWIKHYRRKEGKWPSRYDTQVWTVDAEDQWIAMAGETWVIIDMALYHGYHGLKCKGSSIARLREKHQLYDEKASSALSGPGIVRWIQLFRTKVGRWPRASDPTVWEYEQAMQTWSAVPGETWSTIDQALFDGARALGAFKGTRLSDLKRDHGLCAPQKEDLTEEIILNWVRQFHEKEGYWPAATDKVVWTRRDVHEWVEVPNEHWGAISMALRSGSRGLRGGSSLWQLRTEHGLCDDNTLTEAMVLHWFQVFHTREGRWPTSNDRHVWKEDAHGHVVQVEGYTWKGVDRALTLGLRGLEGLRGSSLSKFRKSRGLLGSHETILTEERLVGLIRVYRRRMGKWPSLESEVVWDQDAAGDWVQVREENWEGINRALRHGTRGLSAFKGQSLAQFRHHHDLHDQLTEAQVVRWIKLFHEKMDKWPTQYDEQIWDRTEPGAWFLVEDEHWSKIDQALRQRGRGLHEVDATSLPLLRRKHGLHNDLNAQQLIQWLRLFKQKEDRWPNLNDKTIWEQDASGVWVIVKRESWTIVNTALRLGLRGLKEFEGTTLEKFKRQFACAD